VTAAQVRKMVTRLIAAGHWQAGDPDMLTVFDVGYDVTRLAWLLADLPVRVLGRLRSDRVLYCPRPPGTGDSGAPVRRGAEFALADPATWPGPQVTTSTAISRVRHSDGLGMDPAASAGVSRVYRRRRAGPRVCPALRDPHWLSCAGSAARAALRRCRCRPSCRCRRLSRSRGPVPSCRGQAEHLVEHAA
jgi:hypothetical protein